MKQRYLWSLIIFTLVAVAGATVAFHLNRPAHDLAAVSAAPRPVTLGELEGKWRGNVIRRNIELNPCHPECDQIELFVRRLSKEEAILVSVANESPFTFSGELSNMYIMSIEAFRLNPRRRQVLPDSSPGSLEVSKNGDTVLGFGGLGGCISFKASFVADRLLLRDGFVDVDLERVE